MLCEQIGILTRLFRFPKEVHDCFCVEQASFRIFASNVLRARKNNKFPVKMRSQSRFCAGELQHTRSKMKFQCQRSIFAPFITRRQLQSHANHAQARPDEYKKLNAVASRGSGLDSHIVHDRLLSLSRETRHCNMRQCSSVGERTPSLAARASRLARCGCPRQSKE